MKTSRYPFVLPGVLMFLLVRNANFQVLTPEYISITTNTKAFYEYLPQGYSYSSFAKYPLILFLHELSENGNDNPTNLPKLFNNPVPRLLNQSAYLSFLTATTSKNGLAL